MKIKSISLFVALFSFAILLIVGCYKEENITPDQEQNSTVSMTVKNAGLLSKDEDYNKYVQDFSKFLNQKKDVQTIKRLMKQETLSESDKEVFATAMGFKSKEEFEKFGLLQSSRLKQLDLKYAIKKNSEKSLTQFVENSMLNTNVSSQGKVMVTIEEGGGDGGGDFGLCERKYANCLTIATASGVAAHIACISVDWATAGIGFYVCHGAATLLQTAMSDNCVIDYNECLKPKP